MISAAAQQIVSLYETSALAIEAIAEVEELSVPVVKSILYANSGKYRSDISQKTEEAKALDFQPNDNELALNVIRRVAQFSDDDHTALKAAMFIRNDKKGRLDVKAGLRRLNINVNVLNEHFAKAAEAIAASVTPTKSLGSGPIIDT